jgi:hypothetical protein
MKILLMIAALSLAAPVAQPDKPAPDRRALTDKNLAPQDQRPLSHRLHWDSMREQINPAVPAKEGAGPEIR